MDKKLHTHQQPARVTVSSKTITGVHDYAPSTISYSTITSYQVAQSFDNSTRSTTVLHLCACYFTPCLYTGEAQDSMTYVAHTIVCMHAKGKTQYVQQLKQYAAAPVMQGYPTATLLLECIRSCSALQKPTQQCTPCLYKWMLHNRRKDNELL
jgi:hypothetical protein